MQRAALVNLGELATYDLVGEARTSSTSLACPFDSYSPWCF